MKTAIYIRVSTQEQAKEGYSIPAQMKKLKAFCISQEWDVAGIYADEGISAKNMERPQLQKMLNDIEKGKIECVLVYRLDRFTRSVRDLYNMLEILDKHDCKFKSATEVYDTTTAMGRMFITIVAALAQWERENTGERLSMGMREKVEQGKWALNFAPIGYDLDNVNFKLHINNDEADTVRLIFKLYRKGYGAARVCRHLNERGLGTKAGEMWSDSTLMTVIDNPVYYGAIRWKDLLIEDAHEPIIEKEYFESTQLIKKSRRGKEPRRVSSRYFFSGKLKCLSCRRPLTGCYATYKNAAGEIQKYMNYRCRKKKDGLCKGMRIVNEVRLEESFINYLESGKYVESINQKSETGLRLINQEKHNENDLREFTLKLKKIENRKKNFQYAWADGNMSYDDYKKRMEESNKEEEIIKGKIEIIEPEPDKKFSLEELEKVLSDIKRNWNKLDDMEKKNLVNLIVDQIHYDIDDEGSITIESIEFN